MSTAWRTEKVRRPRAEFQPFADLLASEMPAGAEWYFGGSWRRGAEMIGDLDIVVVLESGSFTDSLLGAGCELPASVSYQRRGDQIAQGDLTIGEVTVHVDFWVCTPAQRGAFLAFITGPKDLNIAQRAAALRQGLHLSQVGVLTADGQQVDDGTEKGVYDVLGMTWIEPTDREIFSTPAASQVREVQVPSSKPGQFYTVKVDNLGRAECNCKGYSYRRNCRHTAEGIRILSAS